MILPLSEKLLLLIMIQNSSFISVNRGSFSGNYEWTDGTSIAATKSNWRTSAGEPDNLAGNEDCVELHDDGKWNDNWCERSFAFICQKHKSKCHSVI